MLKAKEKEIRLFVNSSQKIAEIASVLTDLKIYHFTFLERFQTGEVVYFSNSAEWIKDYFGKGLYESSQFDKPAPDFQDFEYVIWPSESPLPVYQYAREHYNSDHGITLIKKRPKSRRFFFFSTTQDLAIVKQVYINNLEALERFVSFFEIEAEAEIRAAYKLMRIAPHKKASTLQNPALSKAETLKKFYQKTQIDLPGNVVMPSLGFIKISPQEWRCLRFLSQHYTTPEIAEKLGLSTRTIETYLNSLKNKFGCFRKTELFERALRFKYLFEGA